MSVTLMDRAISAAEKKPVHYDFIQQQLPRWLTDTGSQRITSLKNLTPDIALIHANALPSAQHNSLKQALGNHWTTQNALDKKLAALSDIKAFAEPLLKDALKDYGDIDILHTWIRVYAPAKLAWWAKNVLHGVTSRITTLLDAALHNFSTEENFAEFTFLSDEDIRGQRQLLTFQHKETGQALTTEDFKTLCRNLDIGARYQQKIRATLGFDDAAIAAPLHLDIISNLKAALNSAAHLGLAKKDITQDAYELVQALLRGDSRLELNGQPMDFYTLDLLETRLIGVLVIAPTQVGPETMRMLAYIPEDPEHPLKEYASSLDFVKELTSQLRDKNPVPESSRPSYQQFFSQFIAHQERGRFFNQLNSVLSPLRWLPRERGDSRPSWRETPEQAPNLQFHIEAVRDDTAHRAKDPTYDDLWHYLYRVKLNKIVNDAQEIAISTAYADRMARWNWWDNLENMLTDIFNAALLVVTPFVPFLGELMMAYTAYQVLNDVFEGIVDWAEGRQLEGWEQTLAVAENLIQLGLFHAGGKITEVARLKLSPFVDGLKPVQTPTGDTRLWHPDLTPYQQRSLRLPPTIVPEENGLHPHQGKQILRVDNRHYEVRQDPASETFHLAHPRRSDAYRPQVTLNGSGACVLEGEEPRAWSNTRLMRRLGPLAEGLSAGELEQTRVISAVDYGALRQMYVRNEPTPALLADTLKRFNNEKRIKDDVEKIRTAMPLDPSSFWFEQTVTELAGWPQDKALLVYQRSDLTGDFRRYGSSTAQGNDALAVSTAEVMSGQLPEKIVTFLSQRQVSGLLGETLPASEQQKALRERLAEHVVQQTDSITRHLYMEQESSSDPHVQLLRTQYPELPLSIAQRLVRHIRARDLNVMSEDNRLPLDVKNQARELHFEAESTRVFEQLYQGKNLSAQAESLALNTLRIHTDALSKLRIEVRERTPTGDIRIQVGAQDAPNVRVLVRNRNAQYRVFNAQGKLVHGTTDFYTAVFQALTNDERFTDGERLRAWLVDKTKVPAQRRLVLAEPPIRAQAEPETLILLGGGFVSTLRGAPADEISPPTLQQRIKKWLPAMSEQSVRSFAQKAESPDGLKVLERLETESAAFENTLDTYVRSKTQWRDDSPLAAEVRKQRADFATLLFDAWREGYTRLHDESTPNRGARLDLSRMQWPDKLPTLPTEMRQVTRLFMNDSEITSERANFLKYFPHLKVLDLSANHLETLPPAIAHMRLLKQLSLSGNRIVLDAPAVERLRNLTRLTLLNLANNPLGTAPDISLMPNLNTLLLANTGIREWPTGLFAQPRNDEFVLELQRNPITTVPDVARNSESAITIALTRLDRAPLSIEALNLFEGYRTAVGLDPYRTYEPQGRSDFWLEGLGDENRYLYHELWMDLEHEDGSQGFFEVLKALEPAEVFEDPIDEALYAQNSTLLRSQVRSMLLAMDADGDLRQTLFRMSSFPGLCPDAGMQIFNSMGIEVEVSQARLFSRTPAEREERTVKLAKGAAHLKLLNHVARADIANRLKPVAEGGLGLRLNSDMVDGEPGTVDEVEVHLAYQTRLARRLGLPWISEHMVYRETAQVPEASITQAHTAVLQLSEGDGLVDQMLLEPYWESFLQEHYASDYEANESSIDDQFSLLDQLHSEQQALVQSPDLTDAQKAEKREHLKTLVEQLQVEDRVVPDELMSDELYSQLLNDLGERRKEWLREMTRQSLKRIDE
ncbi:hypothetical protein HKK55_19560 [Pseudomonas sp. ADAK18]|uniref:dermonecrotic toxin domain-containing protein n=1 Tax=Pseudomonas sp. ADAK18 TaxID=2730848 RepID=UPI0014637830|nr:DUF6543 domain-containing protein [Pseudomonas sp. ADAK18]QJI30810.1 hypothetical protein HKK55_19560 [Pseudomonas sp. ADAK18]